MEQEEERRNWAELNGDVLMLIFRMVGIIDVLTSAGSVCRAWRHVAKYEPENWRRIDMTNLDSNYNALRLMELAIMAIDRSGDRLEEFWIEDFGDDQLLRYICDRTSALKSLRLISCYQIFGEALINTVKKQPLLEDLQVEFGCWSVKFPELVGQEAPNLKHLKLNTLPDDVDDDEDEDEEEHENEDEEEYRHEEDVEIVDGDEEAFGIAKTMHQLRSLQLIGHKLTNKGLKAILEGCPRLESLDIRRCYNVKMDSDMRARCARLTTLRLPDDSLDDYEYNFMFEDEDEDKDDEMVCDDLGDVSFNFEGEPINYDTFPWDMSH